MSEQLTIDGQAEPLTRPELGRSQQTVVNALAERGGLDADEAGALLHASRGKHDEDARCSWCQKEGNSVLLSLRARGLVVHRRGGPWQLVNQLSRPTAPGDPEKTQSDEIPW